MFAIPELSGTVVKAWTVLQSLTDAYGGLTLAEITARTGFSKTATLRLLDTLVHCRLVEMSDLGRYELGLAVSDLARARARNKPVLAEAAPVLRRLVDLTGCTGYIGCLQGLEGIVLHMEIGRQMVVTMAQPGQNFPAHAVAIGKVLLAEQKDDALRRAYEARTPEEADAAPVDLEALLADLGRVRREGYAYASEIYEGMHAFGIALGTSAGAAAISLSMWEPGEGDGGARRQSLDEQKRSIVTHLLETKAKWQKARGLDHVGHA